MEEEKPIFDDIQNNQIPTLVVLLANVLGHGSHHLESAYQKKRYEKQIEQELFEGFARIEEGAENIVTTLIELSKTSPEIFTKRNAKDIMRLFEFAQGLENEENLASFF